MKNKDDKQDAKAMKGMTPAQRKRFEAGDRKMDKKGLSRSADKKADAALARKVKK